MIEVGSSNSIVRPTYRSVSSVRFLERPLTIMGTAKLYFWLLIEGALMGNAWANDR
jgi:hypothetical protein